MHACDRPRTCEPPPYITPPDPRCPPPLTRPHPLTRGLVSRRPHSDSTARSIADHLESQPRARIFKEPAVGRARCRCWRGGSRGPVRRDRCATAMRHAECACGAVRPIVRPHPGAQSAPRSRAARAAPGLRGPPPPPPCAPPPGPPPHACAPPRPALPLQAPAGRGAAAAPRARAAPAPSTRTPARSRAPGGPGTWGWRGPRWARWCGGAASAASAAAAAAAAALVRPASPADTRPFLAGSAGGRDAPAM
jgi:hypothetical protein